MPHPARKFAFPSAYYTDPAPEPLLYAVATRPQLDTIARHIPDDALHLESGACKTGKYDAATGKIEWRAGPTESPPPTEKKQRRKSTAKPRFTPETDPRKDDAIRMYQDERMTYDQIAKQLHMCREYLKRILRCANVRVITVEERGKRKGPPRNYTNQELIAALIQYGTFAEAADALGIDKAVLWRKVKGLPPGEKGKPYRDTLLAAGYGEDGRLGK